MRIMKIEIDVPDGLLDEMDHIVEGFYHSREEYILEKIRQGLVIDEKANKKRKENIIHEVEEEY